MLLKKNGEHRHGLYVMIRQLTLGFCFLTTITFGQSQYAKDSLINRICTTIDSVPGMPDSSRVALGYEKHLYPFLEKYPEEKRKEIGMGIYLRMQMTCKTFAEIILKLAPPNSEWEQIIEKPKRFPDRKTCRDFIKNREYSYIESTGDTVRLSVRADYWTDSFKDGTYSKLKIRWLTDCEFEIEFIESNNFIRKNLSKPGDRYKYYVIERGQNYYYLAVDQPETNKLIRFKVFY